MDSEKVRRVAPPALLAFLSALSIGLHQLSPRLFFPAWPGPWVLILGLAGLVFFGLFAFQKYRGIHSRRQKALALIDSILQKRRALLDPPQNEVILAGRVVARLARNADEDLREITADFSPESLARLDAYLPLLLDEAGGEPEALIRLGVVGTYLGETLCRHRGWNWFFKPDPSLKQFSYLPSVIRRGGRELDPYAWAGDLFGRRRSAADLLNEAR